MNSPNAPTTPNTNQNQASTPLAPGWLVAVGILAAVGFSLVSAPNAPNPPSTKPASGTPTPITSGSSVEIPADLLDRETALMLQKAREIGPSDPMCSSALDPASCMLRYWRNSIPLRTAALDRAIERQSNKVRL